MILRVTFYICGFSQMSESLVGNLVYVTVLYEKNIYWNFNGIRSMVSTKFTFSYKTSEKVALLKTECFIPFWHSVHISMFNNISMFLYCESSGIKRGISLEMFMSLNIFSHLVYLNCVWVVVLTKPAGRVGRTDAVNSHECITFSTRAVMLRQWIELSLADRDDYDGNGRCSSKSSDYGRASMGK